MHISHNMAEKIAIDYKLLVSCPGETMKSIQAGGYHYCNLKYYCCTKQYKAL